MTGGDDGESVEQQLYDAIEKGELNTLRTILEPPLNVDTIVCFYFSCQLSDLYVLNGICTRKPPLVSIAAGFSQLEILQYLLSQSANPNVPDKRV
jgi:hypothetical protein